jgi:hypothetical protein
MLARRFLLSGKEDTLVSIYLVAWAGRIGSWILINFVGVFFHVCCLFGSFHWALFFLVYGILLGWMDGRSLCLASRLLVVAKAASCNFMVRKLLIYGACLWVYGFAGHANCG